MDNYIIIEPGLTNLKKYQILTHKELEEAKNKNAWKKDYLTFSYQKLDG